MADQNPPQNHNSVNPLFNMMDELLARHRHGAAAPADDIPVLTEVAPKTIPSLFDVVDDIPALTDVVEPNLAAKIANIELEWAIDHHEPDIGHLDDEVLIPKPKAKPVSLEIEPLPFQALDTNKKAPAPTPAAPTRIPPAPTVQAAVPTIPQLPPSGFAASKPSVAPNEPVFLDLPMLDLDELARAPTPEYLDLPQIASGSPRDPVEQVPIETFIATDLVLPLDELLAEPSAHQADFMAALDEVSLVAAAIPQVPLDEQEFSTSDLSEYQLDLDALTSEQTSEDTLYVAEPVLAPAPAPEIEPAPAIEAALSIEPSAVIIEPPPVLEVAPSVPPAASASISDLPPTLTLSWDEDEANDEEILLYSSADTHESIAINLDDNTLHVQAPAYIAPAAVSAASPIMSAAAVATATMASAAKEEIEPAAAPNSELSNTPDTINIDSITPKTNIAEAQPAIPPKLTADHVAEITASVGAQLSLDIATEVEKLAKQHFDSLMSQFYSDALNTLSEQIMANLETQLAERISELVASELRSKNLL